MPKPPVLRGTVKFCTMGRNPSKSKTKHAMAENTQKIPHITMRTRYGSINLALFPHKAPKTVANFLRYVREGFYNGTLIHRVVDDFVIQGGGFSSGMTQKPSHEPIVNEATNGLRHVRGSLAMARTTDNPHSASSQFFINVRDNDFLNHTGKKESGWGYCVFGEVTEGMDVVDQINGVPTSTRLGFKDCPITEILIEDMALRD